MIEEASACRLPELDETGAEENDRGDLERKCPAEVQRLTGMLLRFVAARRLCQQHHYGLERQPAVNAPARRGTDPLRPCFPPVPPALHPERRVGQSPQPIARHPDSDD